MEGLFQPTHLFFILLIVLVLFGPGKLPELGKGLGKGIREFKDALRGGAEKVTVSISPASAAVQVNGTQQFSAAVNGGSNGTVTWSVNGVAGGNSAFGSISALGLYTAPSSVPSPDSVSVGARSQADTSASATVTITPYA